MPKKRPPLVLLTHKHTLGPFSCIHLHNFPFESLLGKEHACTCRKIKYGLSQPCHDRTKCRRGSDMQFSLGGRLCSHSKACGVMGCGLDWAISVIFAYVTPRVTNLPVRQRTKTERKLLADDMRNCAAANLNAYTKPRHLFFRSPICSLSRIETVVTEKLHLLDWVLDVFGVSDAFLIFPHILQRPSFPVPYRTPAKEDRHIANKQTWIRHQLTQSRTSAGPTSASALPLSRSIR